MEDEIIEGDDQERRTTHPNLALILLHLASVFCYMQLLLLNFELRVHFLAYMTKRQCCWFTKFVFCGPNHTTVTRNTCNHNQATISRSGFAPPPPPSGGDLPVFGCGGVLPKSSNYDSISDPK